MSNTLISPQPGLTVILPCAGYGERFGAPYPKELHRLDPHRSIVDHALEPVVGFALGRNVRVRVIVVARRHKVATIDYLQDRYGHQLDVGFVFQTDQHSPDLAGAVKAALPFCAGATALVLPDQVIDDPHRTERFAAMVDLLDGVPCAALVALIDDPARLSVEGAVAVSRDGTKLRIDAAAEKPHEPGPYNAAWAVIAASSDRRDLLHDAVTPTGAHRLAGAGAVLVDRFSNVNHVADA